MLRFVLKPWPRYLSAIVAVALGTLLAIPVQRQAGGRVPFITFFPVVTLVAAVAGIGPGLVCTALSAAIVAAYWLPSHATYTISRFSDALALGIYLFAGLVISVVGGSLRRAHLARRESEESLKLHSRVLESMTEGVSVCDEDGTIIYTNAAEDRMFGYAPGELVGRHVSVQNAGPPDESRRLVATVIAQLKARGTWFGGWYNQRKDGSTFHTDSHISALDVGGRRLWVCVQRDVTEQNRARREVEGSEARLRMALEAGNMGTWEWTIATGAVAWSASLEAIHGRAPGSFKGTFEDVLADVFPDDRAHLVSTIQRAVEDRAPYRVEYRIVQPDGGRRWLEARGRLLFDAAGRPERMIGVCMDVSDRRRAQERDRFLATLDDALHTLSDPDEISRTAARVLAELFGCERALYVQVAPDEDYCEVVGEYSPTLPSIAGSYRISQYGADYIATVRANRPYVERDTTRPSLPADERARFASLNIGSFISAPLFKRGRLVAIFVVHDAHPRQWQEHEIDNVSLVASRCWESMERARIARELRDNEERLRMAQEAGGVGTFEFDVATGRSRGSDVFLRIFNAPPGATEYTAGQWEQVIHPEDRQRVFRSLATVVEATDTADCSDEYRIRLPDSTVKWVSYSGRVTRDADGRALKIIGTVADVTGRRRAQEGLRLLADTGVLLAGSLQYERSLTDLARLVVPRLADWCAIDMLEERGALRRVAVVHPDPHKVALAHDLHRRYPPDPDAHGGAWWVIRTGQTICVPVITDEMLASSIPDPEQLRATRELALRSYIAVPLTARGRVIGVLTLIYAESGRTYAPDDVALAEDLARRAAVAVDNAKLFEAERAARNESERASRLKDEFLATLSHELRTPLNAILGWSQLLANGAADDETLREGIAAISRNARAQTQLIEDLLDMSRIVSGKLRLNVETLAPANVVSAAIESIQPAADAKNLKLECRLSPGTGLVSGDPSRLQQAAWNLLTNAVKFTPAGGTIRVALRQDDAHVEVSVSDTGQGIAPEFLPHMFERFRQADASTTRRHGGLGIGLALVKQLVELHGGTVQVQSPGLGRGSTFTIQLPLARGRDNGEAVAAGAPASGAAGLADASLAGISVLVVDDEPDARTLAQRILEERGAAVTTAGSAERGFDILRATRPDVLLSDIGMPEHDGYEFIAWVRGLPADQGGHTPAAALTAFARNEDRERALMAGYHSHVIKPIEPAELVSVVASLSGRATPAAPTP